MRPHILFCFFSCASFLPSEHAFTQQAVDIDSIISGKVRIIGKSRRPIGDPCSGMIDSVRKDRDRYHFHVIADESSKNENPSHFYYSRDQKFDQFFTAMPSESHAYSNDELSGKKIYFFESISCEGDPREFVTKDDVVSGPFFRIRSYLHYTLRESVIEPANELGDFITVDELESGRTYIRGRLNARIGTVQVCRCEIRKNDFNDVMVSSTTIATTKFKPEDLVFYKNGLQLSWTEVSEADLNAVMCYERIECVGLPSSMRKLLFDANFQKDFAIRCVLVIKLPSDS